MRITSLFTRATLLAALTGLACFGLGTSVLRADEDEDDRQSQDEQSPSDESQADDESAAGWASRDEEERADQRAMLGVTLVETRRGVFIAHVLEGGPADQGGLRAGDEIVLLDDEPVSAYQDVLSAVDERRPGELARFVIRRRDRERTFDVALGSRRDYAHGGRHSLPGELIEDATQAAEAIGSGAQRVGRRLREFAEDLDQAAHEVQDSQWQAGDRYDRYSEHDDAESSDREDAYEEGMESRDSADRQADQNYDADENGDNREAAYRDASDEYSQADNEQGEDRQNDREEQAGD